MRLRCGTFAWLFIVTLLLSYQSVLADEFCSEQWACAGVDREGEHLNVWMENRKDYPITLTLSFRAQNLKSASNDNGRFEITRVLQGQQKLSVLTLKPTKQWRDIRYRYDISWTVGDMYAQHDDAKRYRLPFARDKRYPVVQGYYGGYSHQGGSRYAIDYAMPVGTPIHAARAGTVVDLTEHHWRGGANRRYAKYANFVVILHDDGTTGEYYHLKQWGVEVEIGDSVEMGELIGYSGNTGFSSTPHLHFAVYKAKSHGKYESIPIRFLGS